MKLKYNKHIKKIVIVDKGKEIGELEPINVISVLVEAADDFTQEKLKKENGKIIRVLKLPVKAEYFNQIKAGTKTEEYRIIKEYWSKRLIKEYDEVWVTLGYPSSDETDKIIKFKWTGYEIKKIIHKEFGNKEVEVYAIKLEERI